MYFATSFIAFICCSLALAEPLPRYPVPVLRRFDPPTYGNGSSNRTILKPPSLVFRGLSYGGSGCNQGSLSSFSNSDTITISGKDMVAKIGPKVQPEENRKNCQVNIDIVSKDWQYTLNLTADAAKGTKAQVNIEAGVFAQFKETLYFSGSPTQVRIILFSFSANPGEIKVSYSTYANIFIDFNNNKLYRTF